jgi:FAD/FMN-containing dehydrogenase
VDQRWRNWSGSVSFVPQQIARPKNEDELIATIRRARGAGLRIRSVGAGHSSSRLVETSDVLVTLEDLILEPVLESDASHVVVSGGMLLRDVGKALHRFGKAMHNLGDVDVQTIGGALATGTHGTGARLPGLAMALAGGRLVDSRGDVHIIRPDDDRLRACRVSLGALGIFSSVSLAVLPAFELVRREWCAPIEECLHEWRGLVSENRSFDFYWYPRRDETKLRTWSPPEERVRATKTAQLLSEERGPSFEVLTRTRDLRFEEMEYLVPFEAGESCFREVRARILACHRREVAWRVLVRTTAGDDSFLSPAYGRASVAISVHHHAGLPFEGYFRDIEPILRDHAGRPHWGKKHFLRASELRKLYPQWNDFRAVRAALDPEGAMLSPYLRTVLGDGESQS